MSKLYCYPKRQFDSLIKDENSRYISICGTYGVTDQGPELHSMEGPNVLNINFDDCTEVIVSEESGLTYYPITEAQALEIYKFILESGDKDLYIHCLAGKSRSQGVVRFCLDMFPERDYETRVSNPCITPNPEVLRLLKRSYYTEEGIYDDSRN